jgi:hypothetical protein
VPLYLKSHSYGEYVSTGRGPMRTNSMGSRTTRSSSPRCRSRPPPAPGCSAATRTCGMSWRTR